jgi:hypothetical protein
VVVSEIGISTMMEIDWVVYALLATKKNELVIQEVMLSATVTI